MELISKVRNLLFSKFFPFFPKKNENSKFHTLLISSIFTAENVHFTIATRILLCPQNGDTKIYYVRGGAAAATGWQTPTHFFSKKPDFFPVF
jgi:hypothetical protein